MSSKVPDYGVVRSLIFVDITIQCIEAQSALLIVSSAVIGFANFNHRSGTADLFVRSMIGTVTRLKPMLLADFAKLLDTSTADAIAFARSMVLDELPDRFTYRVFPNQSCDEHLEPDEVVYPDDALDDLHDYIEMGRDDCIRYLYRDGRVPEWIDISVGAVDYDFTYIYLRCCGRFTANDERLYYKRCDRGPFGIKSPAIPPHIELGDRETKFWIGDAVRPPRSG